MRKHELYTDYQDHFEYFGNTEIEHICKQDEKTTRHDWIIFPGKGDNSFTHLHVSDAARALILAAETKKEGCWVIADDNSCVWNDFFETVQTYYPHLRTIHVAQSIAYFGTRILDWLYPMLGQSNPYPSGAISCWNMTLPVETGTLRQVLGIEPEFPSIHEGIPAVLDDAISFYWLPSNLDRI